MNPKKTLVAIATALSLTTILATACSGSRTATTTQANTGAQTSATTGATQATATEDAGTVIAKFKQYTYADPAYNNQTLMYSLYLPDGYDAAKTYPLVLFMSDSSKLGADPTLALTSCYGATIWATASEQAKRECIVVVPQYNTGSPVVNDSSQASEYLDITVDLVEYLQSQYSVDASRIYNTGQSMGGMMSIAMDIKYPDLFAASLLVACQWDATLVTPMAHDNLWIVVSEGDTKAYPGENAITAALQTAGATVAQATWDRASTADQFATAVSAMLAQRANVNYTVLTGGDHMSTFDLAYSIEGIRDWLFTQTLAAE